MPLQDTEKEEGEDREERETLAKTEPRAPRVSVGTFFYDLSRKLVVLESLLK